MTIHELLKLTTVLKDPLTISSIIFIILLSLIQISPIKIRPWDIFLGWVGSKINSRLSERINSLEKKLDEHLKEAKEEKIENMRRDILQFCNSCMNRDDHTQEQFRFILKLCDNYETFIETNNLKNGEISSAIAEIRRIYRKCLQTNAFLGTNEKGE